MLVAWMLFIVYASSRSFLGGLSASSSSSSYKTSSTAATSSSSHGIDPATKIGYGDVYGDGPKWYVISLRWIKRWIKKWIKRWIKRWMLGG